MLSCHGELGGDGRSIGRQAGTRSYIQVSTENRDIPAKIDTLGWMLHSVYAVLGVN